MKKVASLKIMALLLCLAMSALLFVGVTSAEEASDAPKNIIFMIGDGMGPNQVNAAHDSVGRDLYMETFPYKGTSSTANVYGQVTDSAAGGTALACGIKTANGRIGVDQNNNPVPNIREFFAERGKKTGLISTVSITDATPAAFGAHNASRTNQSQIAAEFIENGIDVILGGGGSNFSSALRNTATNEKGYTIISTKSQLQSFNGNTKLLGLFQTGNFPYYVDGYPASTPTLAEMTSKAIEILSQNEEGFFLMVEGGAIDLAGHATNLPRNIGETLQFDEAVKVAKEFAEDDGNTLIIVTADHETGGLQKDGDGSYRFTTGNHTGANVPVFAYGAGAENFQGNMINTDIPNKIKALFGDTASSSEAESEEPKVVVPGENILTNGDFETGANGDGAAGWISQGINATIDTNGPHGGSNLLCFWNDEEDLDIEIYQTLTDLPEGKYRVSVWSKAWGTPEAFYLYIKDHGGQEIKIDLNPFGHWEERYLYDIDVTSGTAKIGIVFKGPSSAGGSIDDVLFALQESGEESSETESETESQVESQPASSQESNSSTNSEPAKTGDTANYLAVMLVGLSAFAAAFVLIPKKSYNK